jgi:hypothetical protein
LPLGAGLLVSLEICILLEEEEKGGFVFGLNSERKTPHTDPLLMMVGRRK